MTIQELRKAQFHADCIATEEAIREHWRFRSWYRTTARAMFGGWPDLAAKNDRDIRRLVTRLRRLRAAGGYWRARE